VPLWPFMPISPCSQLPCVSHRYHTRSPLSQKYLLQVMHLFCNLFIFSSFPIHASVHHSASLSLVLTMVCSGQSLSLSFSQSLLTQSLSLSLSQSPLRCSQMKTQILKKHDRLLWCSCSHAKLLR
jgi:hypothetical protein